MVDKQDSCSCRIHNPQTFIKHTKQKHSHYHPTITQINSQSATYHSTIQMSVGCILLTEIHIKYYIHKDVIVLQWIIVSMDIIIYIWTDLEQWIINVQMIMCL